MAEFFEQICSVLAKTGRKYPGQLADCREIKEFFSESSPVKPPVSQEQSPLPPQPFSPVEKSLPPQPERRASGDPMAQLAARLHDCRRCPLAAGRSNIVFGKGDVHARLMFIGEGPGAEEDRSGVPFVGRAGQLLDKMISAMQFSPDEVYIANVVKCRPPDNRAPMPEEMAQCLPFLKEQIDIIRPEVIVTLGAVATKALLNTESGISRLRGKWCDFENIPVMPTFHPAFLLRQESAKKEAWQDLQQVMARFGRVYRKKQ